MGALIVRKNTKLALKDLTSSQLAVAERKAVYTELQQDVKELPIVQLENGKTKQPSAKGLMMKINVKVVETFGTSCKDIDAIDDIFLSNTIRAIRLEIKEILKRYKNAGDCSEIAYERTKKKMDKIVESAKRVHDFRMSELESI